MFNMEINITRLSGIRFLVNSPIIWEIGKKNSGLMVTVPAGFTFDVSIPRWLWWAFSPLNPHFLKAAAVHDFLLENSFRPAFAGAEFHDILKSKGVPAYKRIPMFIAVSLFTIIKRE